MHSPSVIVLVAALSAFTFVVPSASHAETQSEWLQRQLQISDGYAPPPVLLAQEGDRGGRSAIGRGVVQPSHPGKSALRRRVVIQQPAKAYVAAATCQDAVAGGEPPPAPVQVGCAECRVIEPKREADVHGEGLGFAALGALLVFAGFKIMKISGAIQHG
jgi:hypothetical protein